MNTEIKTIVLSLWYCLSDVESLDDLHSQMHKIPVAKGLAGLDMTDVLTTVYAIRRETFQAFWNNNHGEA